MKNKINFAVIITIMVIFKNISIFPQNQPKMQLAVFDFAGKGISQNEVEILSDRFRGELVNTNSFVVIERKIMYDILSEINFSLSGCTETSCAIEAGKLLNAKKVMTGTIGKIGMTYSINVRLIDTESGQIEKFFSKDFVGEIDGLLLSLRDMADQIAGKKVTPAVTIEKQADVKKWTATPSMSVSNVHFEEKSGTISIIYDLSGQYDKKYLISILLSDNNGRSFSIKPKKLSGDIGKNIKPGRNKKIIWYMKEDFPLGLMGSSFVFEVDAKLQKGGIKRPLIIGVGVAAVALIVYIIFKPDKGSIVIDVPGNY
jgi:TolB-like protein